jgi:hypothetical protein
MMLTHQATQDMLQELNRMVILNQQEEILLPKKMIPRLNQLYLLAMDPMELRELIA